MSFLKGVNHVATITGDLDRLADFYGRIFDSPKVIEIQIPRLGRHAFISIGGPATLHVTTLMYGKSTAVIPATSGATSSTEDVSTTLLWKPRPTTTLKSCAVG